MSFARYALFAWGFALPFVSFTSEKMSTGDLASRFTVADFFGALAIVLSIPAGRWLRPRPDFPSLTAGALLFVAGTASFFAVLFSTTAEPLPGIVAPWLILAFLLLVSARGAASLRGEGDIAVLISAVALGACLESLIVGHDLLSRLWGGAMWFRDPMDMRMRGTFRASGQLAQYGFVVGSVLFAAAAWPSDGRARQRFWWSVTGVFLMLYPVFTSRRSGIGAFLVLLVVWLAVSQAYGKPDGRKILPVVVPAALIMAMYLSQAEYRNFLLGRVAAAQERVAPGEGFLMQQIADASESIARNPLLGVGWGLSRSESRTNNEMHSTYLAVLVDSGLTGVIAFGAFILSLLYSAWMLVLRTKGTPFVEFSIRFFAALSAQLVFWIHNRGLRDRGFFLFLAVFAASSFVIKSRGRERAS